MTHTIFVATLGGQPQVVTFALDLLAARSIYPDEVLVVHLSRRDERIGRSLTFLEREFKEGLYRGRACRFHNVEIRLGPRPLEDIRNASDAEVVWQTFHRVFTELKVRHAVVHLSIAGGRRLMGHLAMSAATFLFDRSDHIWHVYTPASVQEEVRDGRRMHPLPRDGAQLIEVPFVPLGAIFPALRELAHARPSEIRAQQMQWLDAVTRQRCRQVWEHLTPRQKEVLRLLASGKTPREVAQTLHISLATVNSHKTTILAETRIAWEIPEGEWLDYRFLQDKFGPCLREMAGS